MLLFWHAEQALVKEFSKECLPLIVFNQVMEINSKNLYSTKQDFNHQKKNPVMACFYIEKNHVSHFNTIFYLKLVLCYIAIAIIYLVK